ncbi:MAG: hypothetical protein MIO92_09715 [Methanosarcinaceae archaeon]|nr:hypothetical protein [Methanosarcinaceae archaeon]
MSGRILIIPTTLALSREFKHSAIRLWLTLQATAEHKDPYGNLINVRDRREIAAQLGMSYINVSNLMLDLQGAGWLRIDRIPDQHGRMVTIFETPQPQAAK